MFWNTTRRQAISAVGKFCHVLGRGFVIQRVIFIFIKSLSDNQNPLLYMKVLYYHQIVTARWRNRLERSHAKLGNIINCQWP